MVIRTRLRSVLSALALYGLVDGLGSNTGSLFLAIGRPQLVTRIAILQLIVLIPGLAIGVSHSGALGAAWAYVASAVVVVPLAYWMLLQELELPVSSLISRIWRSLTAVAVMGLVVEAVGAKLSPPGDLLETALQLGLLVALGGVVYGAVLFGLWFANRRPDGGETHVANLVVERLGALRARTSRS